MRKLLPAILIACSAAPSLAQEPVVPIVTIHLSSFKFTPDTIALRAGQPVVLRFENASGGEHNFAAKDFFANASIDVANAASVHDGTVEVPGHSTVDVRLVPVHGSYKVKCTHFMHSAFGMKGKILVE